MGKNAKVANPIFQLLKLLNHFKQNPLKSKRPKLHVEIPSIAVLIIGNNGALYCLKSVINNVGSTIETMPKTPAKR